MGCKNSKPKIIDTNDLLYFNIINMCNSFHLNVKTIDDVKYKAERFKQVNISEMEIIIISIKPSGSMSFITTVWASAAMSKDNESFSSFNLYSKKYHYTTKDLDSYLNQTINEMFVETN